MTIARRIRFAGYSVAASALTLLAAFLIVAPLGTIS